MRNDESRTQVTLPMIRPAAIPESARRGMAKAKEARTKQAQIREETGLKARVHASTGDPDYSANQVAFLRAVDEFKVRTGRKFPTLIEILEVAESIGWHRQDGTWPADRAEAALATQVA